MTIDAVVESRVERVADGINLLDNLGLIDINTWQNSQEVFKAWQDGAAVKGVNTANLAVYRLEDDEAVFKLLGREGNPFIDESLRKDAYNGILGNKYFVPQGPMKDKIKSAKPLVTVRYSGLTIKIDGCEGTNYGYVVFDGNNNAEEKKLFNAVYGTDNPGIGKRIYLLRKNVVKVQLKNKKEDDLVARACYLDNDQSFIADDRDIDIYVSAVRGVRLDSVAEGDEPKEVGVAPQETDKVIETYTTLGTVLPDEVAKKLVPYVLTHIRNLLQRIVDYKHNSKFY